MIIFACSVTPLSTFGTCKTSSWGNGTHFPLLISWRTRACVEKLANPKTQQFFLFFKGLLAEDCRILHCTSQMVKKFLPKCKQFSRIRTIELFKIIEVLQNKEFLCRVHNLFFVSYINETVGRSQFLSQILHLHMKKRQIQRLILEQQMQRGVKYTEHQPFGRHYLGGSNTSVQ